MPEEPSTESVRIHNLSEESDAFSRSGASAMTVHTGRHFLQIPGPSTVPDRVLRAMDMPTIDHRGPEVRQARPRRDRGLPDHFQNQRSGHHLPVLRHRRLGSVDREHPIAGRQGLDVRDRPLRHAVAELGRKWGIQVDFLPGDWRHGARPEAIEERLATDKATPSRRLRSFTTRPRPA